MFRNGNRIQIAAILLVVGLCNVSFILAKTAPHETDGEKSASTADPADCPHIFLSSMGELHFYSVVHCIPSISGCVPSYPNKVLVYQGSAIPGCASVSEMDCDCNEEKSPVGSLEIVSNQKFESHRVTTNSPAPRKSGVREVIVGANERLIVAAYPPELGKPELSVISSSPLVRVPNGPGNDYYRAITLSLEVDGTKRVDSRRAAVFLTGIPDRADRADPGTVTEGVLTITGSSTKYLIINR